ncbi:Zinc finger BED domain-containing protein 4 [Mycena venus]|uniref:Zinc finger BED domain-containing protein 4 n=1 Tax=Mycena venus TaxID=2733690 RepID=A0A8H7DFB1_9AGAR|nr:Zinc finger BED domain-containing protein 4 [Mycena venus]
MCVDGWNAPQVISFLGITITFVRDGSIESIILNFVKASKSHTGIYLASRIAECLCEYGIQDKILAVVEDKASNNDTMISELADLIPSFSGNKTRVRCFAHVLNLVVKAILLQFSHTKKAKATEVKTLAVWHSTMQDEEDEEDVDLDDLLVDGSDEEAEYVGEEDADNKIDLAAQASDDATLKAALLDIETDIELKDRVPPLTVKDLNLGWNSILKLRTFAKKIFHSPTLRTDLEKACHTCKVRPALMELLEALEPLLDVLLVTTEEVSRSRTPVIHEVIRLFDIITTALDDYMDDVTQPLVAQDKTMTRNKYFFGNSSHVFGPDYLLDWAGAVWASSRMHGT